MALGTLAKCALETADASYGRALAPTGGGDVQGSTRTDAEFGAARVYTVDVPVPKWKSGLRTRHCVPLRTFTQLGRRARPRLRRIPLGSMNSRARSLPNWQRIGTTPSLGPKVVRRPSRGFAASLVCRVPPEAARATRRRPGLRGNPRTAGPDPLRRPGGFALLGSGRPFSSSSTPPIANLPVMNSNLTL